MNIPSSSLSVRWNVQYATIFVSTLLFHAHNWSLSCQAFTPIQQHYPLDLYQNSFRYVSSSSSSSSSTTTTPLFFHSDKNRLNQLDEEEDAGTSTSGSGSYNPVNSHGRRSRQSLRRIVRLKKTRMSQKIKRKSMRFIRPLLANKNDDNEKETNNNKFSGDAPLKAWTDMTSQMKVKWETTASLIQKVLPEPVLKTLKPLYDFIQLLWIGWSKIQWYVLTFSAGAVISITALVVPIYDSVSQLSQPVTLFETILHDLEQAYVEEVDTNKLFETGVSAMLNSLDPYTEFETQTAATALSESIDGRYGGVGLVIAGIPEKKIDSTNPLKRLVSPTTNRNSNNINNKVPTPVTMKDAQVVDSNGDLSTATGTSTIVSDNGAIVDNNIGEVVVDVDVDDDDDDYVLASSANKKQQRYQGIRVVSAFEGYAFDYGLRVGDQLVQVDDLLITPSITIDQVRNRLRGTPGTDVEIAFTRAGVDGTQTITMPRSVVRIRDVKLATLLGDPRDGIGYVQLSGFATDAGREVRNAIRFLQQSTEDANDGEQSLQGLILDLRGNPGGLLTSAVDVASLLVPKGSDIVSAKGRGFPGVIYRSRVDPLIDTSKVKLAVMINGNTASAAEIVSGAVQDLDVGVIVGPDRTFGKGLVQNVEELPFNTALKFTVAKYYTPSGRCIQGVQYTEGGGVISGDNDGRYIAKKVSEQDRNTFYTRLGRTVKDGGGVEADFKVANPKASVLEITLIRSGLLEDFAAEWSKQHELTNHFNVDEETYRQFQNFVTEKQRSKEIQLESLYSKSLVDLKQALEKSGYPGSAKSVEQLQARIVQDMKNDFEKYRSDIKEDIETAILARYLPESMLIERSIKTDIQIAEAVKLLKSRQKFDTLLAKGSTLEQPGSSTTVPMLAATTTGKSSRTTTTTTTSLGTNPIIMNFQNNEKDIQGFKSTIEW